MAKLGRPRTITPEGATEYSRSASLPRFTFAMPTELAEWLGQYPTKKKAEVVVRALQHYRRFVEKLKSQTQQGGSKS